LNPLELLHLVRISPTFKLGSGFKATDEKDQFKLKIFTGGHNAASVADARAMKDIKTYATSQGYSRYTVSRDGSR
jgi:hypothetical protein